MERIDKILAHEGFGSRKDIKKLLRNYEVLLNGTRIFDSATQIDPEKDTIIVDGEEINLHQNIYLMMNKIMHTVSSNKDGEHQTVFDLLDDDMKTPYLQDKLHIIGRLDMDTEGFLIFTTDGNLTHKLISPKTHVGKTYFCILEHSETEEHKKQIEKQFFDGIHIAAEDNEPEADCQSGAIVKWLDDAAASKYIQNSSWEGSANTYALLTIYEGKYHQVKRMFAAVDNKIVFLKRIAIGKTTLDPSLAPGEYRELSDEEIDNLMAE